jgi:hypothetical protein
MAAKGSGVAGGNAAEDLDGLCRGLRALGRREVGVVAPDELVEREAGARAMGAGVLRARGGRRERVAGGSIEDEDAGLGVRRRHVDVPWAEAEVTGEGATSLHGVVVELQHGEAGRRRGAHDGLCSDGEGPKVPELVAAERTTRGLVEEVHAARPDERAVIEETAFGLRRRCGSTWRATASRWSVGRGGQRQLRSSMEM